MQYLVVEYEKGTNEILDVLLTTKNKTKANYFAKTQPAEETSEFRVKNNINKKHEAIKITY